MRFLKVKGLWYKSVPEFTEYDEEWDGGSGSCSGCHFEHDECSRIRHSMEVDCAEDYEYNPDTEDGVIYVPIEVKDIPLIAEKENGNE